jgi:APA family basic amino acid/polyamine antiporter
MALIAGFLPIGTVAELVNIGTLAAFVLVCGGVIYMRRTRPELARPFRTPFSPVIPALGMLFCAYLMYSLPAVTWIRFFVWMGLGLIVYFSYSRHHSALALSA